VSWTTSKTSSDYTPAVAIWPSGQTRKGNVLAARLDSVESAQHKHARNDVAYVQPSDEETVLRNLAGMV